jgi:hypothetical protein
MTLHEAEHAPGKEKENVDLVIAHWVMFAPGLSGMYETIKELVLAEMQLPGVEAGIVEPENKEGGKSDGWITTQSHGWAQERATIHVSSYFMTGYSTMQRPRVMLIHGTPEACYEAERESGSYTAVIGSLQNLDASVVMNKRQFSMWKPYDHRGILHCIEKGIDLSRYTPKGMRIDLNGEPAVGMGEVERKGGVKLPLLPYAAVNEYYQKNPLVRLHHWGVTQERPVLDILFHKTLFDKWLGKYRLMGLQLYPDQWYRGCDLLLSPSLYGDPSRVHFEAMACFPAGVEISSPFVTRTYRRYYTGELVTIETETDFPLTMTPNHPIFTQRGIVPAKYLTLEDSCYRHDSQRRQTSLVDRGSIEYIEKTLSHNHHKRNCENLKQNYFKHPWAGYPLRSAYNSERLADNVRHSIVRERLSVLGRDHRWRRNIVSEKTFTENFDDSAVYSYNSNRKQFRSITEMAGAKNLVVAKYSSIQMSKSKDLQLHSRRPRHINSLPLAQEIETLLGDKADALSNIAHALGITIAGTYEISDDQWAIGASKLFEMVEPEAITKIRHSNARGIEVFNLSTVTGWYFAEGLLVHNCGTPVIDLDSSLRWGDSHATMHARALDSINMAECIAKLYDQIRVDKAKVRKEAREIAEKYYDIKRTAAQLVQILRRVQDEVGAK